MARIGLVSCVSEKRPIASLAKDLYDSALFGKSRAYVERHCDKWYLLSSKYGLVDPETVIASYDDTLNSKPRAERARWAEQVWSALQPKISSNDQITILAGEKYREFLAGRLSEYGCEVCVPLKGLKIGYQLQWLSQRLASSNRGQDVERLYGILRRLESGLGGKRLMRDCGGHLAWPRSGMYFFFEPGEHRQDTGESRVVRVGTHGVSRGSSSTLWKRLYAHRGYGDGRGNHRGSIFRLHVGAAIANKERKAAVQSWSIGQSASAEIRAAEVELERRVSIHLGPMGLLWLAIEDSASPGSDRAYLERNVVGMLAGKTGPLDPPSPEWLGAYSPEERIRNSGLWNLNHLSVDYRAECLDILDEYVSITLGTTPKPQQSLAPEGWHTRV
ncbi:MAG: hypothetical protein HYV27_18505 [Candidatus Hydrogenedentes bacterium]|nr:hypothetical protein [Candidatus Hydrogenedentota bacterium]